MGSSPETTSAVEGVHLARTVKLRSGPDLGGGWVSATNCLTTRVPPWITSLVESRRTRTTTDYSSRAGFSCTVLALAPLVTLSKQQHSALPWFGPTSSSPITIWQPAGLSNAGLCARQDSGCVRQIQRKANSKTGELSLKPNSVFRRKRSGQRLRRLSDWIL